MRTAIVYDFDGTLARGNMQDVALLPKLGLKTKSQIDAFWKDVLKQTQSEDGDQVLAYLRRLVEVGHEQGAPLTRETLKAAGRALAYFEGVEGWFDRISAFGRTLAAVPSRRRICPGVVRDCGGAWRRLRRSLQGRSADSFSWRRRRGPRRCRGARRGALRGG